MAEIKNTNAPAITNYVPEGRGGVEWIDMLGTLMGAPTPPTELYPAFEFQTES